MVVLVFVVPADVDFAHRGKREGVDICFWFVSQIGGRDKNIVHIQKQPAACAFDELRQEVCLAPRAFGKCEVA